MNNLLQSQLSEHISNDNQSNIPEIALDVIGESIVHKVHEQPSTKDLLQMYSCQDRECWLCEGIAKKIKNNETLSEDDSWHFTSCVLSWEHIQNLSGH